MKKYCMFFIFMVIANQSFADIGATNGVPDPATCNSGVLDTESGGVALQAQYIPETISLQWYDNNTLLNVTSTNSNSCTYGTGINLPTNPTKTGYKFTGWKVVPQYDFSTLPTDIPQRSCGRYSKGYDSSIETEVCGWAENGECTSAYDDLNINEWKTTCGFGTVYGMALCSSTAGGGTLQAGTPSESTPGGYCWCKVTGFIPTDSSIKYKSLYSLPWVKSLSYSDFSTCLRSCHIACTYHINFHSTWPSVAFGQSNN